MVLMEPSAPRAVPQSRRPGAAGGHRVRFYRDETFLSGEIARFVGAALGAGDAAVVIATPAHLAGLADRLAERGLDLARAAARDRYIPLDAAETLAEVAPGGRFDAARFGALAAATLARAGAASVTGRVAVFGELVALLALAGRHDAAVACERCWDELVRAHGCDLLCAYPLDAFGRAAHGAVLSEVCALHDAVGPTEEFVAVPDDDARLRAVARLEQRAAALDAEVAAREEFLSVAAHELRTPLTSLRAYAQLILRDLRRGRPVAPERLETALGAIEQQTGRLNLLIGRLIEGGRGGAGRPRVEPVPTDLVALVRDALVPLRDRHGFTFALEGPPALVAPVDPPRFAQVVANLLDNAIRFSPEGGAITVALGRGDDGGIRLAVTDHGIGIPPDEREAVFGRFARGRGADTCGGLGLGLHLARAIVADHGGTIRAESPAHPGARLVITLPQA